MLTAPRSAHLDTAPREPRAFVAVPAARAGLAGTFEARLVWLRSVAADEPMPERLHIRGVEPDSALGSPELAPAFRRYINANHGKDVNEVGRFVYPLHAALARLANGGTTERSRPFCARTIFEVIRSGFDWQRVADRLEWPHEAFELFLGGAIRLLYEQYSSHPTRN